MKKILTFFVLIYISCSLLAQTRTDSVHVAHYDIHLSVIDFSGKKIDGYADLSIVSKVNDLAYVDLDLQGFTVDSVKVNSITVSSFTYQSPLLRVQGITGWDENDTIEVRVYYRGTPASSQWGGFFFSGEYAYNLGTLIYDYPHSFGRSWFPCLDVFNDKATYTCNIRTLNTHRAICGGTPTDSITLPDNTKIWKWELHDPVPTYLASIAVGNYQSYKDTFHGINGAIPIEIYASPAGVGFVPGSFANLKNILQIFEDRFGAYQWERVGYVVIPFGAGAMEHATNIAYPQYAVDGSLVQEDLLAHELAHSWFGNLITCARAEDMWINEGFASFCEAIYREMLYPESDGYKEKIRELHLSALRSAHTSDGGYFALSNIPQESTYGITAYHKGGAVAHTLRQYLGDDLFFPAMKALMSHYAYGNLISQEMFTFLSEQTGVNLQDFYEGWVNQPGFLHFSVDSIVGEGANNYRVFVKQRLHHADHYANSNIIEVTLFSEMGQTYTDSLHFSGQFGNKQFTIPFAPVYAVVDYDDKLSDAISDYNIILKSTGSVNYADDYFKIEIQGITDSVFFRMEHNYVAPDPLKTPNQYIYRISDNHYWRVEYTPANKLNGIVQFRFAPAMDYELMQGYSRDDLVLLYRRNPSEDWRIIPSVSSGASLAGYLRTTSVMPGEYALAIGDRSAKVSEIEQGGIMIFPNPAQESITIRCENYVDFDYVSLYDNQGKEVKKTKLRSHDTVIVTSNLANGTYFLHFCDEKGKLRVVKQIIIKN